MHLNVLSNPIHEFPRNGFGVALIENLISRGLLGLETHINRMRKNQQILSKKRVQVHA